MIIYLRDPMGDESQIPVNSKAVLAIENDCVYIQLNGETQAIIPLGNIVAIVKYG